VSGKVKTTSFSSAMPSPHFTMEKGNEGRVERPQVNIGGQTRASKIFRRGEHLTSYRSLEKRWQPS